MISLGEQLIGVAKQFLAQKKTFILYSIIGLSGATLDFLVFIVLTKFLPIHYLLANAISTSVGIVNNFILNSKYSFGVRDKMFRRFLSFYAIGLIGLGVASLLLVALVDWAGLAPSASKLLVIIVVVALQYNLNKSISFRRTRQ